MRQAPHTVQEKPLPSLGTRSFTQGGRVWAHACIQVVPTEFNRALAIDVTTVMSCKSFCFFSVISVIFRVCMAKECSVVQ